MHSIYIVQYRLMNHPLERYINVNVLLIIEQKTVRRILNLSVEYQIYFTLTLLHRLTISIDWFTLPKQEKSL